MNGLAAELGHAEKVMQKLGPRADYLLVKEVNGYGHIAVLQTVAIYAPKIGEFLQKLMST